MPLSLTSTAFEHGAAIPPLYTCQGQDISPPLSWAGVPSGTASLVLIIDDPDAPDPAAPKMTWVHWVVFNLPPDVNGLEAAATLPAGATAGLNDWKVSHYKGPCPPVGAHRYFTSCTRWTSFSTACAIPPRRKSKRSWWDTFSIRQHWWARIARPERDPAR